VRTTPTPLRPGTSDSSWTDRDDPQIELVCPRRWFEDLLTGGLHPHGEETVFGAPLGVAAAPGRLRLLVRQPFRPAPPGLQPEVRVCFRSGQPAATPPRPDAPWGVQLVIGRGPAEGRWAGWLWTANHGQASVVPIARILLPGPGMLRLEAHPEPEPPDPFHTGDRWSRSRAALGEAAWARLVHLRVGVVGCGRLGSTIASALARNGLRSLVLVDPDRVEPHNLGESEGFQPADLDLPKAQALATALARSCPWTHPEPVPAPVQSWTALNALKHCDLLVCAADNPQARHTAGLLSALYHLPLVEAGTGVFASPTGGRRLGLQVRLLLPGYACRPCLEGEPAEPGLLPWWAQRMGSLRSLNLLAAGAALRLLEGLVSEEFTEPVELYWVWGESCRWTTLSASCAGPRCLQPVQGSGDDGLTTSDDG